MNLMDTTNMGRLEYLAHAVERDVSEAEICEECDRCVSIERIERIANGVRTVEFVQKCDMSGAAASFAAVSSACLLDERSPLTLDSQDSQVRRRRTGRPSRCNRPVRVDEPED